MTPLAVIVGLRGLPEGHCAPLEIVLMYLFPSVVDPKVVQFIYSLTKLIQLSSASLGFKCKGRNTGERLQRGASGVLGRIRRAGILFMEEKGFRKRQGGMRKRQRAGQMQHDGP